MKKLYHRFPVGKEQEPRRLRPMALGFKTYEIARLLVADEPGVL